MTRQTKTITVVQCALYGEELPALDTATLSRLAGAAHF
jgi:hypothetical protein